MARTEVPCTLLVPNQPVPSDSAASEGPVPRSEAETVRVGSAPRRIDAFASGGSIERIVSGRRVPVEIHPEAAPLSSALGRASTLDPDTRYVELDRLHGEIQTFIDENRGHIGSGELMDRSIRSLMSDYFALRNADSMREVLAGEFPENSSRLDHFDISHLTRPDGSELIIQRTAEGPRRIDVDPPTLMLCDTVGETEVTTEGTTTIITEPTTLCTVVPIEVPAPTE